MKLRAMLTLIILIPILWLVACAPSTGNSVTVSCDDFGTQKNITRQLTVSSGSSFTVTLCSNATTGFSWLESAQISDTTVIEQTNHTRIAPENTGLVGAPGTEVWTFKALKKGTSNIDLQYSQPWEGGQKGAWTFNLSVTVK
ncbi:MAG TPA: protease inhibitor I42 family protein [Dehalococcoidia bacterium]